MPGSIDLVDGVDDFTDSEEEREQPYEDGEKKPEKPLNPAAKPKKAKRIKYKINPSTGKVLFDPATNQPVPEDPKPREPRAVLNDARLCGPTGLPALVDEFQGVQWHGKGHEDEDLMLMMTKLEGWAHRMYPKFKFDDVLDKVEQLGNKRRVRTTVKKLILDMPILPEDFVSAPEEIPSTTSGVPGVRRQLQFNQTASGNAFPTGKPTSSREFTEDNIDEDIMAEMDQDWLDIRKTAPSATVSDLPTGSRELTEEELQALTADQDDDDDWRDDRPQLPAPSAMVSADADVQLNIDEALDFVNSL